MIHIRLELYIQVHAYDIHRIGALSAHYRAWRSKKQYIDYMRQFSRQYQILYFWWINFL